MKRIKKGQVYKNENHASKFSLKLFIYVLFVKFVCVNFSVLYYQYQTKIQVQNFTKENQNYHDLNTVPATSNYHSTSSFLLIPFVSAGETEEINNKKKSAKHKGEKTRKKQNTNSKKKKRKRANKLRRTDQDCLQKGFDSLILECRTCKKMKNLIESQSDSIDLSIVQDCLSCCGKDASDNKSGNLYESVILLVDPKSLEYYSDINKIVEQKKSFQESNHPELEDDPFPFLEIEYQRRTSPNLILYEKGKDEATDMIDVSRWNYETIMDFFNERVVEES